LKRTYLGAEALKCQRAARLQSSTAWDDMRSTDDVSLVAAFSSYPQQDVMSI